MKQLIILFGLVCATTGMAQEPEVFAWWDRPIARNLNLTPEQTKQVKATVREFRDRLIEQRASVQKAEAHLRDLMEADQINEALTREAIEKVVVARSELLRSVSLMSLRMRTVLTPEQWQKVRRRAAQQVLQRRQQRGAGPVGGQPGPAPRPGPRGPVY
ncbi:MAG: Spy/CpxP family protein refolding chaperone [Bryobacteraceae bacterium]